MLAHRVGAPCRSPGTLYWRSDHNAAPTCLRPASRTAQRVATAAPPAAAARRAAGSARAARSGGSRASAARCAAASSSNTSASWTAADLPLLLTGVRIVLVAPKTPANIGAVLRVAENFEAHDVVVVAPRCDARCAEVAVTSCDSAVLGSLRVVDSLAEALADCTGSIGFTRRAGAGRRVFASLRQLLARFPGAVPALLEPPHALLGARGLAPAGEAGAADGPAAATESPTATAGAAAAAAGGTTALVFGREESGLLEAELALCSHACAIPSGRSQPSLNLSHAVAVVASQLFDLQQQRLLALEQQQQQQQQQQGGNAAACRGSSVDGAAGSSEDGAQQQAAVLALLAGGAGVSGSLFEGDKARWQREQVLGGASQAELEALLARAAALLEAAGMDARESVGGGDKSNHGRRKLLMGHVRSLLLRSQASTPEVRALHGLLREAEARLQAPPQGD